MTDGSLKMPEFVDWPIFPFVGELSVRDLEAVNDTEHPRMGEPGNRPCLCEIGEFRESVFSTERWTVREIRRDDEAAPFPAYMLETVDHLDFGDLDDDMAAEYGLLSVRLERALMSTGTVGRVHVNRWGDGGSHFHVWFLGRPKGAWQFSGFSLAMWFHILPPLPDEQIAVNNLAVARALELGRPQSSD